MLSGAAHTNVWCPHPQCDALIPVRFEPGIYTMDDLPCICRGCRIRLEVDGGKVSVRLETRSSRSGGR